MASIRFEVRHQFGAPPVQVWEELIDWEGHASWVPATRVEVDPGDPTAVGATFTAFTGFGPLTLEDRMRVVRCEWLEAADRGECEVDKLGPLLSGRARFGVAPEGEGALVHWVEDVTVPYVPRVAAPLLARLGAMGFRAAMRRLADRLAETLDAPSPPSAS